MTQLSLKDAYRAAFYFLENAWTESKSEDLAGILGEMNWELWLDRAAADPAMASRWKKAVEKALNDGCSDLPRDI